MRFLVLAMMLAVLPLAAWAQSENTPPYTPPPSIPPPVPSVATPPPLPPSLYPGYQVPNTPPANVLTAPQTTPLVDRVGACATILDDKARGLCIERAGQN
jgi:hypothetical protein